MRAAPAVNVRAAPSSYWQASLLCLSAVMLAATALWAWQRNEAAAWGIWAAASMLAAGCLWRARRRSVLALRWDGERWWLVRPGRAEMAGEVSVALDLGAWLLLRFQAPRRAASWPRHVWLPLQRTGLEAHWHALRCAIYSPRPQATPPAASDSSA